MSHPSPAALLEHRGPALLLGAIDAFDGHQLLCTSRGTGPWRWPEILEGAAQSAGLMAGMQPGGPSATAVIAEYRGVIVHAPSHAGTIRYAARLVRRLLHFWRCRIEARSVDGKLLLEGEVTLSPKARARA